MHYSATQYAAAADDLQCESEMVESVCIKEVLKKLTFRHAGKDLQQILYEKHVLWDLLEKSDTKPRDVLRQNPAFADVLGQSPYSSYGKYIKQYQRRERACLISREAAFAACSYSGFQIMGYHYGKCGYESAEAFAIAMDDPANHIPAFVAFIKSDPDLHKCLQSRDFEGFARRYNGRDYWKKGYHIELARIYQRILARNLPRHESPVVALVKSQTVQRAGAAVVTASAPAAPLLLEGSNITDVVDQVRQLTDQGKAMAGQVTELHEQAQAITQQLGWVDWMPWLASGWSVLLVLIFIAVGRRYLLDRGYLHAE